MKKYNTYLFILLAALVTFSSCKRSCDQGYEGKHCDVEIRDKYLGAWNATDNPGNIAYTDSINKKTTGITDISDILNVTVSKQFGPKTLSRIVTASIGNGIINIAWQHYDTSRAYLSGVGTFSNNNQTINWSYQFMSFNNGDTTITPYTGVWIK